MYLLFAIFIVTENKVNHKRKLVNQVVELHIIKYYISLK